MMNKNDFGRLIDDFKYHNMPFGNGFFGILVGCIGGSKTKRRIRLKMLRMGLELIKRSGAIVYGDEWVIEENRKKLLK